MPSEAASGKKRRELAKMVIDPSDSSLESVDALSVTHSAKLLIDIEQLVTDLQS